MKVIVTRPQPYCDELCAFLEAEKFSTVALPAQKIEFDLEQASRFSDALKQISASTLIFSSRNAVLAVADDIKAIQDTDDGSAFIYAAVGAGTAAELEKLGVKQVIYPHEGYSAIHLMALPEMVAINDRDVFLVSGQNPRPGLLNECTQRNSRVQSFYVYRRINQSHAEETLRAAYLGADALLLSNTESAQNVVENTPNALHAALFDLQCICVSDRVAAIAVELGFNKTPVVIERADNVSWLSALTSLSTHQPRINTGSEGMSESSTDNQTSDAKPTEADVKTAPATTEAVAFPSVTLPKTPLPRLRSRLARYRPEGSRTKTGL